jgi:two-component system chemotaxis sensor kinase CheA
MDIDREALVQLFLAEADDHLRAMEEALLALETRPGDQELLGTVFRGAHTLKGNALSLGFAALAEVAHALEDLLDPLRAGAALTADLVSLLLQALDELRVLSGDAAAGRAEGQPGHERLLQQLRASNPTAAAEPGPGPKLRSETAPPPGATTERRRDLRVEAAKLDRLLDLAGETAIARGRLGQALERSGDVSALEAHHECDRLLLDMQELILEARLVPLGPTFRAYARTVREVAAALGKQARLVIEGEEVEVDTSVMEHLRDPLTHMIRNAIGHGLEPPARRRARGKDPVGTLRLRAQREAGHIAIELGDDGAGLDRERITERARQRGLAVGSARLSEAELQRLIFEPSFSTAETVTDVSGRGVGLDVVRRNVEALHGSVTVDSREGQGTSFTLRLPLSLAIINGFGVAVAGETYVVPLGVVIECLDLPPDNAWPDGQGVLYLRGEALPCLRLRRHFGLDGRAARESVVVVQHEGGRAGLAVDGLLGERQTVIKPLGALLQGLPGIAGSAILGDGRVAMILDVPGLLREALTNGSRQSTVNSQRTTDDSNEQEKETERC